MIEKSIQRTGWHTPWPKKTSQYCLEHILKFSIGKIIYQYLRKSLWKKTSQKKFQILICCFKFLTSYIGIFNLPMINMHVLTYSHSFFFFVVPSNRPFKRVRRVPWPSYQRGPVAQRVFKEEKGIWAWEEVQV